ncbi:MAG: malto-oligosyltrehalose synthase [Deltaproteobacteria bacterium]|nr:malto-oligosyltrehalose synthase [Deltaproteobacteria bacterium]
MPIPNATYRLQFNLGFTFGAARTAVRYLAELGISNLYASPIFEARPGSLHGYDILDPNALNPELGSLPEFEALLREVSEAGLSWLQDIVPNHLAFDGGNRMIRELLEQGPRSRYRRYFDIDWDYPSETLRGKLLVPFLGRFYSECLETGQIRLELGRGGLAIACPGLSLPLRLESYGDFLTHDLPRLEKKLGRGHPDLGRFLESVRFFSQPPGDFSTPWSLEGIERHKGKLWELHEHNQAIQEFLEANLDLFNGVPGQPESFDLLDGLLAAQFFRLSFWKFANEEINYRRFFTINDLISARVEEPEVFDDLHRLIFRLVDEKKVSGLRIDHVDGLYDPSDYLNRLRSGHDGLYIVVEKILAPGEELPLFWPVQGTTGYDFLNQVNGLFVNRENQGKLDRLYRNLTRERIPYHATLLEKKRLICGHHLAGSVDNLARYLKGISRNDRYGRDITLYGLKRALVEVMARFTVYRTYVNKESCRPADAGQIRAAVEAAQRGNRRLEHEFRFIERFMTMACDDSLGAAEREPAVGFMMRFQQLTGPLMAKAFEDTFFYIYNRFISLNEVGGEPRRFGVTVDQFHEFNRHRREFSPHALSATATHDTKRGEDVRARLDVLSELPTEWSYQVRRWKRLNAPWKKELAAGLKAPDGNDEYYLYQTLIGAFPFGVEELPDFAARIQGHLVKAVREAKTHSDWLNPEESYEAALRDFVASILRLTPDNPFLRAFLPLQRKVAHFGILNSLSQTLLKIAAPGVPDFYQGCELWDLRLADPDNRGPVDFDKRRRLLGALPREEALAPECLRELLERKEDGRLKLFLIQRALRARQRHLDLFRSGDYLPLTGEGEHRGHLVAFARRSGDSWALAIVPRLCVQLLGGREEWPLGEGVWAETAVPLPKGAPGRWQDAVTGAVLEGRKKIFIGRALARFPAALLLSTEERP